MPRTTAHLMLQTNGLERPRSEVQPKRRIGKSVELPEVGAPYATSVHAQCLAISPPPLLLLPIVKSASHKVVSEPLVVTHVDLHNLHHQNLMRLTGKFCLHLRNLKLFLVLNS